MKTTSLVGRRAMQNAAWIVVVGGVLLAGRMAHGAPLLWNLDPTQSPVTLSGYGMIGSTQYPITEQTPNSLKANADFDLYTDVVGPLAAGSTIQFIDPATVDPDTFTRYIRMNPQGSGTWNPVSGGTFAGKVNLGAFGTGYVTNTSNVYNFLRSFITSSPLVLSAGVTPNTLNFSGTGTMTIWETTASWRLNAGSVNATNLNGLVSATFPINGTITDLDTPTPHVNLPFTSTFTSSATLGPITEPVIFSFDGTLVGTYFVPEPASVGLAAFGVGTVVLAALSRRRRNPSVNRRAATGRSTQDICRN